MNEGINDSLHLKERLENFKIISKMYVLLAKQQQTQTTFSIYTFNLALVAMFKYHNFRQCQQQYSGGFLIHASGY
jgi:hypothetical protein